MSDTTPTPSSNQVWEVIEGGFDDLSSDFAIDGWPSGRTVAEKLTPLVMALLTSEAPRTEDDRDG